MAEKEKRDWKMYYEKNKEKASAARMKYAKTHETQIKFVLNTDKDSDIIQHLTAQGNRTGYLKRLIREDMERIYNQILYGTPEPQSTDDDLDDVVGEEN